MQRYSSLRRLQRLSHNLRTLSTSDLPWKHKESHYKESQYRESHYKSLCKLTLIGRTGTEPEIREFDNGKVLSLRVATNSANGHTQWHSVLVSENAPGFSFLQDLPVGAQVYVEGSMKLNRVLRDDGNEKTYVNVNVYPGMGMFRVLRYPGSRRMSDDEELPF